MKKDDRQAYKDVMSYEYKRGYKAGYRAGKKSLETAITKAYKDGRLEFFREIIEAIKNPTPQYATEEEFIEFLTEDK